MTLLSAPPTFRRVTVCRICGAGLPAAFLSLGATPLANALVTPDQRAEAEASYPLEVTRCDGCGLVELTIVVRPEIMFREYLYTSSASSPLAGHFDTYAEEIATRFAPPGSFVAEIGSNDGVLLRPLHARGLQVLGIEPSTNIAALANAQGLETVNEFFGLEVAERIASTHGRARTILANNVLAHIDDLADVMAGLDALLDADGVFVAEVPYLLDLLKHVEYDTIYHEHLSYFALAPLQRLFRSGGLELFDVHRLAIHGGSVRVFVGRRGKRGPTAELVAALAAERAAGLEDPATLRLFASRVAASRETLCRMLMDLRGEGRTVAGLGATAKGNTLLNYCGIGPELVAYVADSTPLKVGRLTPGMRIPIRAERTIVDERPDYTLLLAWNYADAILAKFRDYTAAGGRFIHPIPLARVMTS